MLGRRGLQLQVDQLALHCRDDVQIAAQAGGAELHSGGHVAAQPAAQLARHVPLQGGAETGRPAEEAVAVARRPDQDAQLDQRVSQRLLLGGGEVARRLARREVAPALDGPAQEEAERVVTEKLAEALGGLAVQVARERKVGPARLGTEAAARQHGHGFSRRQQLSGRDRLRGGRLGFHLPRSISLVNWWWGLYLFSGVAGIVATDRHPFGVQDLHSMATTQVWLHVLRLTTAVLFLVMVRGAQARQDEQWLDLERQRNVPQPAADALR